MNNRKEKKQDVGLKRNTIDKYYTSKSTVEMCISLFTNKINVESNDIIIEPSAGNGAFIEGLRNLGCCVFPYDIEPEHKDIIKYDYLKVETNYKSDGNRIFVIGNPPFGRQSSMAIKFIKKACSYCDALGFILPKSFKKDSMKKYFPINYHLVEQNDIPYESFIVDEMPYDVPCVFQVWEKREEPRVINNIVEPEGYKFVKKNNNPSPDISVRRVGVYAGHITREFQDKNDQTHYFIKFKEKLQDDTLNNLRCIVFDCKNNTAGPCSISKPELIREFNNVLT